MKMIKALTFLLGLLFALVLGVALHLGFLFVAASVVALATLLNSRKAALCATLSVPEIMMDVMDAFKVEIPFLTSAFTTDFSSKTAVKNDYITAHVSTLPSVQDYDATNGFNNNVADSENLISDVTVRLDTFKHVPIRVKYLSQLASKMPLYKEAIRNYAYVLAKKVVDDTLAIVKAANFTNNFVLPVANTNLDQMENIRSQANTQKLARRGRFGIVSTSFASYLQQDDRIKSSLFYGQLNGNEGYRHFSNVSGFGDIWEYPDYPANSEQSNGFFADKRALVIANRRVDFGSAAAELQIPQIMAFYPLSDPDTGLQMTGVGWQQPGTGDAYVSAAILYGITGGKMTVNSIANGTDAALIRVTEV